jgi:hypothetical protein
MTFFECEANDMTTICGSLRLPSPLTVLSCRLFETHAPELPLAIWAHGRPARVITFQLSHTRGTRRQ